MIPCRTALVCARVHARSVSVYVPRAYMCGIRGINTHLRDSRARRPRRETQADRSKEAERILIISVCQFNFQR